MKNIINKSDFTLKDVIQYCIIVAGFVSTFTFFQAKVNSNEKEIIKINTLLNEVELKVLRSEIADLKQDIADIKEKTDATLDNLNKFVIDYYKNRE